MMALMSEEMGKYPALLSVADDILTLPAEKEENAAAARPSKQLLSSFG